MQFPPVFTYHLAKCIWYLTRKLGQGGGSAAPGLLALKLNTNLLSNLRSKIRHEIIVIAGTNGKTTTSSLIRNQLSHKYAAVLNNNTGSNLERGIISAFIQDFKPFSPNNSYDAAVLEVDEAVLPTVISQLQPTHLVLTNLFRDQLDRYGEVESIKNKWQQSLQKITSPCQIYANVADPQIADLITKLQNSHLSFTTYLLKDTRSPQTPTDDLFAPLEQGICPQCGSLLPLAYSAIVGQGLFQCQNCQFHNHQVTHTLERTPTHDTLTSPLNSLKLHTHHKDTISLQNTLAAYLVLTNLNCQITFEQLAQNSPQKFGRFETIHTKAGELLIVLIKNPTGFTESLRSVTHQNYPFQTAAFILNDNFADGQDISWIWDVPLHKYLPRTLTEVHASGSRASDMALRLHYAFDAKLSIKVQPTLPTILQSLSKKSGHTVIFATYTAMLQIQQWLSDNKIKSEYWK